MSGVMERSVQPQVSMQDHLHQVFAHSVSFGDTGEMAYLGRQPILDRNQQLLGYELFYRSDGNQTQADFADAVHASLVVIAALLQDVGTEQVLGGKTAFINIAAQSLNEDAAIQLLEPHRTVLELPADCALDSGAINRLESLRKAGFGVAIAVDSLATLRLPQFALATHVKIDLHKVGMDSLERLTQLLNAMRGRRLLVAEKVETREQAARCLELGFDALQGYYFARPETLSARKLEPGKAAVMQAIRLLLRNADIVEVDQALKRDIALSVKLLRYMNSAGMGLSKKIDSLKSAINLMGYSKLARWLTLLLATADSRDPTGQILARTAITRGRLIELLGEAQFEFSQRDNLFITGTFSLLPAMLMVSMDEAITDLDLPADVISALQDRSGPIGSYLRLVEACESPSLQGVDRLCRELGIAPKALNLAQMQAADWVQRLGI